MITQFEKREGGGIEANQKKPTSNYLEILDYSIITNSFSVLYHCFC